MAAPNIVNTANIYGKTAVQAISTVTSNIVVNDANSGKVVKVNTLIVSNVDGANAANITANLVRSSTNYRLVSTISVPANSTLVVVNKTSSLYLEESDRITLLSSANLRLEAVCSYEEIS